jgi:chromosome segregation ATPase
MITAAMSARARDRASKDATDAALRKQIAELGQKFIEADDAIRKRAGLVDKLEAELSEANGEIRSLKHMLESADRQAAQSAFDIRRLTRINAALAEIVGNQAACLTGIDRARVREERATAETEMGARSLGGERI